MTFALGSVYPVSLLGRHNGRVFDERDVSFTLGEGAEQSIPDGVEQALQKFKKHERSLLQLKAAYAFGSVGHEQFGLPANADVEYEVELKSFEKAKEAWSMDADEKLEQAKICKEQGTNHFKAGKFALAIKQYKKIVSFLEFEKSKPLFLSIDTELETKIYCFRTSISVVYCLFCFIVL